VAEPFFSVIIPVYNRAEALRAALRSVLDQTFQDFEIIVVDDGSQDDPRAVAESFQDGRLRLIRQVNAGGGAARNTGIDNANGRFLAFLDSDDVFLPHHLGNMHRLLTESHDLVGYAPVWVDRGAGPAFLKPPRSILPGEEMAQYLLCDRGFTQTSTMVAPLRAAKQVRFNEHLRAAEDTDFAIRLHVAGWRLQMLEQPGAIWNDRNDPMRTSSDSDVEQPRAWLESIKPIVTAKAYHGARGWMYAKRVAKNRPFIALGLYLNAVLRGCYRPSLAVVVFLQIFLGAGVYRRLANWVVAAVPLGRPRRRRASAPVAVS
jgi:glycosyltransferase involved in cell wall biosynthesis